MKKLIIFTYLLILSLSTAFASEVTLTLKEMAVVSDSSVRVKDIASLKGDKEMAEQIANCVISSSPLVGYKKNIARDYLRLRLKQQKVDTASISFAGVDQVTVSRKSKLITGKELFDNVKELIIEQLPWDREVISLSTYRDAHDQLVPYAEIEYEVELINEAVSGRRLNIEITIFADGEEFIQIPMAIKLSRFVDVVVTKQSIERGDIIDASQLYLSRQEMGPKIAKSFTTIDSLVGKEAIGKIQENHVIVDRMVAMPMVVKRRQIATLVYEKNNLVIRTKVQTKENGRVGDIIRVINPDTKKEILAQVMAKGLLRYAL